MIQVVFGSALFGLTAQTNFVDVMSLCQSGSMCPFFLIKTMVSVLLMCLLPPCANHPNLFVADKLHASLYFGFLSRWIYSSSSPISSSNTAFTMQQGACNENLPVASCKGEGKAAWWMAERIHFNTDAYSCCCMGSCVESWGIQPVNAHLRSVASGCSLIHWVWGELWCNNQTLLLD